MGLKADLRFQVTLRREDRVSPGGGGGEEQPKERMGTEDWEAEGGICHGQMTSGRLFPAADPSLALPQQLEKWDNQGLNPLLGFSKQGRRRF